MVCVSWFTSDQRLIGKMPMPSALTHIYTRWLLPALWLINFPDRACPTIKCSPSCLCRIQSVPPLSCVSPRSLAHFSSPGLWLRLPKMSGQRTSPRRTSASLIFSFFSFLFPILFISGYFHLAWKIQLCSCSCPQPSRVVSPLNRVLVLQFPPVLTALNLLILSSPQSLSVFSLCVCVSSALSSMLFTALVLALCVTPVSLVGRFEEERSVLINHTERPTFDQVRQASKELSGIHMVLIEVSWHSFYTRVWCTVCVLHACKHTLLWERFFHFCSCLTTKRLSCYTRTCLHVYIVAHRKQSPNVTVLHGFTSHHRCKINFNAVVVRSGWCGNNPLLQCAVYG